MILHDLVGCKNYQSSVDLDCGTTEFLNPINIQESRFGVSYIMRSESLIVRGQVKTN